MRSSITYLCIAALLAGCATMGQLQFHVAVDSLASPVAQEHRTYILLPGNEGATWDDLQFQEYALYMMRVLHAHGFVSAESAEDADVAIVLSYGIGDPQTRQHTYSLPVWGQTGVSSAHTYGTATAYGNMATYSGTTTYTPTYGVTGYTTHTRSVTSYFRYALITAYDFKEFRESNKQVQLWRTKVTSSGSSEDLRRVFPVLMGAAAPYIATNTGKQVETRLYESDDIVRAVKGEPVQ
jgi:hypothetical protein